MPETLPPFRPPGSAVLEDLERLDLRVARILEAAPLAGARRPAYQLLLDVGTARRRSSARITGHYPDPGALVGRLVVAIVNLPPRRVAGYDSEVLVLGALDGDGEVHLLGVDDGAEPGQAIA